MCWARPNEYVSRNPQPSPSVRRRDRSIAGFAKIKGHARMIARLENEDSCLGSVTDQCRVPAQARTAGRMRATRMAQYHRRAHLPPWRVLQAPHCPKQGTRGPTHRSARPSGRQSKNSESKEIWSGGPTGTLVRRTGEATENRNAPPEHSKRFVSHSAGPQEVRQQRCVCYAAKLQKHSENDEQQQILMANVTNCVKVLARGTKHARTHV